MKLISTPFIKYLIIDGNREFRLFRIFNAFLVFSPESLNIIDVSVKRVIEISSYFFNESVELESLFREKGFNVTRQNSNGIGDSDIPRLSERLPIDSLLKFYIFQVRIHCFCIELENDSDKINFLEALKDISKEYRYKTFWYSQEHNLTVIK